MSIIKKNTNKTNKEIKRYYDSLYYTEKIDNIAFKNEVQELIKDIYDGKFWTITYHGFANILAPKLYQFFDVLKYKRNWGIGFVVDVIEILKKIKLILEKYPKEDFLSYEDLQQGNDIYIKKLYNQEFKKLLDKLIALVNELGQLYYQYDKVQEENEDNKELLTELKYSIEGKIEQIKLTSNDILYYLK